MNGQNNPGDQQTKFKWGQPGNFGKTVNNRCQNINPTSKNTGISRKGKCCNGAFTSLFLAEIVGQRFSTARMLESPRII